MLAGTHQYQRFWVENAVDRNRSKAPYQRPGIRTMPDSIRPVPGDHFQQAVDTFGDAFDDAERDSGRAQDTRQIDR